MPALLEGRCPAPSVTAREVEIRDASGHLLRRHVKGERKGQFVLEEGDRLFNPSRETDRLLEKAARIGPQTEQLARTLFARLGRCQEVSPDLGCPLSRRRPGGGL